MSDIKSEKHKHETKITHLQKKLEKSMEQNRQMIINQSKMVANNLGENLHGPNRNQNGTHHGSQGLLGQNSLIDNSRDDRNGAINIEYSDLNNASSHAKTSVGKSGQNQ